MNLELELIEKLGWRVSGKRLGDIEIPQGGNVWRTVQLPVTDSSVVVAAYAEAEMAERGWEFQVSINGWIRFKQYRPGEGRLIHTKWESFDRTSPLEKSQAVIKACLEALELSK